MESKVKKNLLEVQVFVSEVRFDNAGGFHSRPEHIVLGGDVGWLRDPVQRVQVVGGRVVELVLPGPGKALLHALVRPQPLHDCGQLGGQSA